LATNDHIHAAKYEWCWKYFSFQWNTHFSLWVIRRREESNEEVKIKLKNNQSFKEKNDKKKSFKKDLHEKKKT